MFPISALHQPSSTARTTPFVLGVTVFNKEIRESFDNIHLDLSKQSGKCRLAESGLGWKPSGGSSFTIDKADFQSAQWSRAARGYELKIYSRSHGVVQLDGFNNEVNATDCRGDVR